MTSLYHYALIDPYWSYAGRLRDFQTREEAVRFAKALKRIKSDLAVVRLDKEFKIINFIKK